MASTIFSSLSNLARQQPVLTDNAVFRLHYKFTSMVLLGSVVLGTMGFFGKYIECLNNDDFPEDAINAFCWVQSTFSLPSAWNKTVGEDVPYPGIERYRKGQHRVYHRYYQWVYVMLFIQSVMFYMPHHLWKMIEGHRISKLVLGLKLNNPILSKKKREEGKELMVDYLGTHLGHHSIYFVVHVLMEILNLVNVIGQIFMVDSFLGGQFTTFGTRVLTFSETDQEFRNDPMMQIFPRMAKCTFHRFGPSGSVQRHDAFCILPLNILNEKIYIFLWFWFIVLAVLSALAIIYRLFTILSSGLRRKMLDWKARLTHSNDVDQLLRYCSVSDWFIIYLLCKNLDGENFNLVVVDLLRELSGETETMRVKDKA